MKIAIYYPTYVGLSVRNYTDNVIRELVELGVEVMRFSERGKLPAETDIYWNPCLAGGSAPSRIFRRKLEKPVVVTLHGVAPLAMAWKEYFPSIPSALRGKVLNLRNFLLWQQCQGNINAIITVSNYAKWEITKYLKLKPENIHPIHHGVDLTSFFPRNTIQKEEAYFFHVSAYQPKKNINRVIDAYIQLKKNNQTIIPRMLIIAANSNKKWPIVNGLEIITQPKSHNKLRHIYQGALGFLFPSLQETFGMPILEAMASGCPVITSNTTGCIEVAGDAALLVNPRSVDEITCAMQRLIEEPQLRVTLRRKGLERAKQFTWKKCAEEHLKVFKKVLTHGK